MSQLAKTSRLNVRLKVFQPTTVRTGSIDTRAHLLNLSVTGALVHHATPPRAGSVVEIGCCGAMRFGQVRWAGDSHFGVQFWSPVSEEILSGALSAREALVAVESERIGKLR